MDLRSAPAVLVLAACAALLAYGATRLPLTGAWTLATSAAILAAAAIALAARQLWAFVFALLFWTLAALGMGALAAYGGHEAVTHGAGGEWAGVRRLVIGGAAAGAIVGSLLSAALTATLALGWRPHAERRSGAAWAASTAVALVALAGLAWLTGDRFWRQRLLEQNECLAGAGARCTLLARDERFPQPRRDAFALRGCEAGEDAACGLLLAALEPARGVAGPALAAIDARCAKGNPELCQDLGALLLRSGDAQAAAERLERACATDVRWCDASARVAQEHGAEPLALALRQRGCDRDDARACRGLLRQAGTSMPGEARDRLELKTCLVGDVNDCRALMQRDLRRTCDAICAGSAESRMHSCGYCAREAAAKGERALAAAWLAGPCERGYRWACSNLEELRRAALAAPPQVSR